MHNLSIRHLRAFITIAKLGSFTQAAKQLHVTQSSLTATIKQLEQEVGLKLFDRTTRRVEVNMEGQRFEHVALQLISNFDTAISDLEAIATGLSGQINIAASASIISQLLPPAIKQFQSSFPSVSMTIIDDNAVGIENRVINNEVDFGLGSNHSNGTELNYQPLLSDNYGLVVPTTHTFAKLDKLQWRQVQDQTLVSLTSDSGIRAQLAQSSPMIQQALSKNQLTLEVSNPAGLAEMIHQGIGVSILPKLTASTRAYSGLVFIPITSPTIERELYIISRSARSLTPTAIKMIEYIKNSFQTDSSFTDNLRIPFTE